ncbi:hypothetical protein ELB75_02550 [Eikenella corrodens]|uniref:Uncharacterized protein n=1 Tax=Eikenella corrodens TaxID=539 RepID=A0A3S9SHT0_EIKCO|nr:hypothetical protein ELB75_02550 [Eikenella corrodens]
MKGSRRCLPIYSELNLNQYSVVSPCRNVCTVFGSPPCPDLNLIHYRLCRHFHQRLPETGFECFR